MNNVLPVTSVQNPLLPDPLSPDPQPSDAHLSDPQLSDPHFSDPHFSDPFLMNHLLAALPAKDRQELLQKAHTVQLSRDKVLYDNGQRIDTVYFPLDCLISVLAVGGPHQFLEVVVIGKEGVLGASVALGRDLAQVRAVVRHPGAALAISRADFMQEFVQSSALQRVLYRYTDTLLAQVTQIAACSHFHRLEARLARTLLSMREHLQSDQFHLTHEFLAMALGVRRVGVTKSAQSLQEKKLIYYHRGNIQILNPAGLLEVACICYPVLQAQDHGASAQAFI